MSGGAPATRRTGVPLRDPAELQALRRAGQSAAQVLAMVAPRVRAGVSTAELDRWCHDFIVHELKLVPANIGYHGYRHTLCTSVNQVVCHGIPSADQVLRDGDIVNLDVAVVQDGWYGDTSRMFCIGTPSALAQRLVDTTWQALQAAIAQVRPGATLGDVGHAIQQVAQQAGFSVVREYAGHGIGRIYHDEPSVLHHGQRGQGLRLQPGMVFTIEPMLNAGKRGVRLLADGWTVETTDRSLSAQWEHMVAVTATGVEVLTPWPDQPAGPGTSAAGAAA